MTEIGRPFTQDVLGNVARTCLGITDGSNPDSLRDISTEENGNGVAKESKEASEVEEDGAAEHYRSNLNGLQDSISDMPHWLEKEGLEVCSACKKEITIVIELGGQWCPYCGNSLTQ